MPVLGRLVSCLLAQGFSRLVVVVGYLDEKIRDYLESHASGLMVYFVDCREYAATNSIYSLSRAREHIRKPFVLIESDLVFDSHLLGLMRVRDRITMAGPAPIAGIDLDPVGPGLRFGPAPPGLAGKKSSVPPFWALLGPFYTPSVILWPLRGSGYRVSIGGSMLVSQLFFSARRSGDANR